MGWRDFSAQEIVDMPVNELAVLVLEDWVQSGQWNLWNFVNSTQGLPRPAREALSEAQAWLLNNGCLARDPQKSSSEAAFVTRAGHALLEHGEEPLKAAERLNLDLHPRLTKVQTQFLLGEYELVCIRSNARGRNLCQGTFESGRVIDRHEVDDIRAPPRGSVARR
jgi:hypothetical protein